MKTKKIKTHCRHGHEWVAANIYVLPSTGAQKCLVCQKESAARTAEKKRALRAPKEERTRCARGHELTEGNTYVQPKTGWRACKTCQRESTKRSHDKLKDTPEVVARMRVHRAKWREENPDYHKFHGLFRDYKITREDYEQMLVRQDFKCLICQRELTEDVHVDHDHDCCPRQRKTCGKCIRGILCPNCNQGLGQFKDNEEFVRRAYEYLKAYRETRGHI